MEGLDKSVTLSEGAVEIEQAGKVNEGAENRKCLNCDTPLTDVYCPHCGQKDIPKRQTLTELLTNFVSSFWSYESKFFKTWSYLLFRPGFLPVQYTEGKRERYYHPARMYVFISFIYFLLLSTLPSTNDLDDEKSSSDISYNGNGTSFNFDSLTYESRAQYDSTQATLAPEKRHGLLKKLIIYRGIELNAKYKNKGDEFRRDFGDSYTAHIPKVVFFLLPVFALILKLLYVRRDFFYSEHLVFSIYYYNFFFLAGSIYLLMDQVPWLQWVSTIVGFWIVIYLLIAMKRMYKQHWGKTIGKFLLFFILFGLCISLGLLVNLALTLMYI